MWRSLEGISGARSVESTRRTSAGVGGGGPPWVSASLGSPIGARFAYWRMSPSVARPRVTSMELRVTFEPGEPPCGRVALVGRPDEESRVAIPFIGWLGLLRVLSDLFAEPDGP